MSVLECNRNGCESIMCDNYSYTYGYLCDDCKQELIESNVYMSISEFMQSTKEYDCCEDEKWVAEIEAEFPSRYEELV